MRFERPGSLLHALYGPKLLTGEVGGSVTIKCFYRPTKTNRHDRKYWCKISRARRVCNTIISTSFFISEDYRDRASITDFPKNGTFTIQITQLEQNDAGAYRCGIGNSNKALFFSMNLTVLESTVLVLGKLRGSVTIQCQPENVKRGGKKFWCKLGKTGCSIIADSDGYVATKYERRISITSEESSGTFKILINRLKKEDSGLTCSYILAVLEQSYSCPNVPEEAELYYIELGGSVTINCVFGTEYGSERKYMCRMGKTGCSNVIDTYGNVNENYKGRVLLSLQEPAGSFSLYMTQLRKEDSGVYLCGAGIYGEKGESKELDIHQVFNFVSPETSVPQGPHVINGVIGGSVSVECHYDPRGNYTLKYWCKWRKNGCNQLITNLATMIDSYEGRIVLHDNPENGTFTVIMNQLTAEDAGYYWCITDGETERKSTKELKIIDGQPGLTGAKEIDAVIGTRVTIPCSYPCKYYSYQKYWCKWHNTGCQSLISSEQNQTGLVVNCDKEKRTLYLTFDQVIQTDQGWYWCGVSHSGHYGETMAVYLTVNGGELQHLLQDKTGKVFPVAMMEHDSSKVILSVLLPIAVVCLLLATVFVVVKFRLLKRTDLVSVGSYRTNISMSEFENSRDYGAKDNMGINDAQETQLGGQNFKKNVSSKQLQTGWFLQWTKCITYKTDSPRSAYNIKCKVMHIGKNNLNYTHKTS
uniref:Polymeric immunoglobulin receptor n=1 Tax=Gopherus evgoodei TaxID=1825980 RepID=A0A8C4VKS0_9SAUR